MNKQQRLDMIERLQDENAQTAIDMAERRARGTAPEWTPPAAQRKPTQRQADVTLANAVMRHADQHINEQVARAVDLLTRVLGSETARNEARMHKELIQRQDNASDALRTELAALRGEVADLREIVNALAADVSSLADDIELRSGRKIVAAWPKRGHHA